MEFLLIYLAENLKSETFVKMSITNKLTFIERSIQILKTQDTENQIAGGDANITFKRIHTLTQNDGSADEKIAAGTINALYSLYNNVHPGARKALADLDSMDWFLEAKKKIDPEWSGIPPASGISMNKIYGSRGFQAKKQTVQEQLAVIGQIKGLTWALELEYVLSLSKYLKLLQYETIFFEYFFISDLIIIHYIFLVTEQKRPA
jgi:hypothetical protein